MKRRLLTLLLAALLGFGVPAAQSARADDELGGSDTNSAVAINTKDGSSVFKLAFSIRHVRDGVVNQTNIAFAYAKCVDCRTVAIAIQIVLVDTPPSVVTPKNEAVAFNELCSVCVTFASAYQFVIGRGARLEFDEQGHEILDQIRQDLHDLKHQTLTVVELRTRLDAIAAQIKDVLNNHLVPAQNGDEKGQDEVGPTVNSDTSTGG